MLKLKHWVVFIVIVVVTVSIFWFWALLNEMDKANQDQLFYWQDKQLKLELEVTELRYDLKKTQEQLKNFQEQMDKLIEVSERTGLPLEVCYLVDKTAKDPAMVLGLFITESRCNPNARNVNNDGTVDRGLGQINDRLAPSLWQQVFPNEPYCPQKLFDPVINAKLTVAHFNNLAESYQNPHTILTAYNRGEGGMRTYQRTYGTSRSKYSKEVLQNAMAFK